MTAIALAIGSSLVYGVSAFLGGLKSRSLPLLSVLLVSQASALVILTALVVAFADGPPSGGLIADGALAGLAEAVAVAAHYRGLAVGTMSIVAPVAATAPVVAVVASIALGETPNAIQGAGIALAVAAGELPVLASIGALIVAADAMYAVASTKGLLSVVAVLSSLYPVVTIVLARV